MSTTLAQDLRVARKRHMCNDCERPIEPGSLYLDNRVAGDGTVWTWREHPLCHRVYMRLHRDFELYDDETVDPQEIRDFLDSDKVAGLEVA